LHLAHRLAWLYVHGIWPERKIDHINGNPCDNRLVNLRDVSQAQNMQNYRKAKSGSALGIQGVTRNGTGFMAQLTVNYKNVYLGTFRTSEAAHEAYLVAKRNLHPFSTL
jgi:HNH endonuclease